MSSLAAGYVPGKLGPYFAPTLEHVDAHLRRLTGRLTDDRLKPSTKVKLRADIDALLDRRARMTAEVLA